MDEIDSNQVFQIVIFLKLFLKKRVEEAMTTVLYLSVHVLFLGIDLVFLRDLFLAIGSRTPFLLN